jgi:hypothetical protein
MESCKPETESAITEILSDANIFVKVNPDFMDTPIAYSMALAFPANRDFYREIRDNVMNIIIRLCLKHEYLDYVIKFSCGETISPDKCNISIKKTKKIKRHCREIKRMNDFIMMRSTDIKLCIQTKCSCINTGLLFLFKLKQHIENVCIPKFQEEEAEIRRITQLSDDALKRSFNNDNIASIKKLRKKSDKFIARAEELSSIADYNYYTIELLKRIYLRELNKIISSY